MYRPEFNANRLVIIQKLNEIIRLQAVKRELTDNEYRAILTARNFIKAYYDKAEHEVKKMTNEEAIKYLIKPFATSTKSYNEYLKQKEAYDLAIKALENEQLQGEWIIRGFKQDCSNCGFTFSVDMSKDNFCPNCGSYNRGKEE